MVRQTSWMCVGACLVSAFAATAAWAQDRAAPLSEKFGKAKPLSLVPKEQKLKSIRAVQAAAAKQENAEGNVQGYTVWNLEFKDERSCREFDVDGVAILTRFDRFADVFTPDEDEAVLTALDSAPGLVWADLNQWGVVPPPPRPTPKKEAPRQVPDKIVRNGFRGAQGKGVIVAVLDSGIDFHHPDFITQDSSGKPVSRVLYFWDTASDAYANGVGEPAPVKYPNGAPIGTIYNRDTLTQELRRAPYRIAVWDTDGHGTACAGVAAGNGGASGGEYAGVAPQADIIAVRLSSGAYEGAMDNSYLLGAVCGWLDQAAGQQPMVVSCSFGGQMGGRDGSRIEERQLDARFPLTKTKRAICIAAGNEGADPLHAGLEIHGEDDPGLLTWYAPNGADLEIYLPGTDPDDLLMGPLGETQVSEPSGGVHAISGQLVINFSAGPGEGGVFLTSASGKAYLGDAYIYGEGAGFSDDCVTYERLVGTPGAAGNPITVGSYDWNDRFSQHGEVLLIDDPFGDVLEIGGLSAYSSVGPRRGDDAVKPEVVGPGEWFTAPAPTNVFALRDSTNHYQIFNGTSAATPYVAGIVALMLEKKPTLTLAQIKKLLEENATRDPRTGETPNARWGHGKLDVKAVTKIFDRL